MEQGTEMSIELFDYALSDSTSQDTGDQMNVLLATVWDFNPSQLEPTDLIVSASPYESSSGSSRPSLTSYPTDSTTGSSPQTSEQSRSQSEEGEDSIRKEVCASLKIR